MKSRHSLQPTCYCDVSEQLIVSKHRAPFNVWMINTTFYTLSNIVCLIRIFTAYVFIIQIYSINKSIYLNMIFATLSISLGWLFDDFCIFVMSDCNATPVSKSSLCRVAFQTYECVMKWHTLKKLHRIAFTCVRWQIVFFITFARIYYQWWRFLMYEW